MDLVHKDIDTYLTKLAAHGDPILAEMEAIGAQRDFPIVGPQVGRLLEVVARACNARRVLELGSGFGYSAYWFLRAVGAEGTVLLTEGSEERAKEADEFLTRGGFAGRYRIEVGDGLAIAELLSGPFDIVFCDIDKQDYPQALPVARNLLRVGGLFITDNMLWNGNILTPKADDKTTRGVVELTKALYAAPDFVAALAPVRDGVTIAIKVTP